MKKTTSSRLEMRLFSVYNKKINRNHCRGCFEQDSKIASKYKGERKRCPPQSFWNIGKNLSKEDVPIRLAFVGKTSWNNAKLLRKDRKIGSVKDCRYMGPDRLNDKTAYWTTLRATIEGLELTLDDVFITNFAKCNIYEVRRNSSTNITDWEYFDACKDIIEREIEIVKPTHVIFLTGDNYDSLIKDMSFGCKPSEIVDQTSHSHKKKIPFKYESRKNSVCWWYRTFRRDNGTKMHLLRTRHPQGAPGKFEREIRKWVRQTHRHSVRETR